MESRRASATRTGESLLTTGDTTPEVESRLSEHRALTGLLWLHPREQFVPFDKGTLLFGRGKECSVVLPSEHVSRTHATLRRIGPLHVLSDAKSRNGTSVNGRMIQETPLSPNDVVRIGDWVGVVTELEADCPETGPYFQRSVTGAIIGPRSAALWRRLEKVAAGTVPILIEGPTGTGKEVLARAIHQLSRRSGAFVGVNCAALPESLVEAQLFGHARGAYTGATQSGDGLIASANHGTLLLDEIIDLPATQQAKLLRVLEEAAVLRLGESVPRAVDVRVLAACQKPLWGLVQQAEFRADLLARLSGCTLRLTALCERREEIPRLFAEAFVAAGGDTHRLKSSAIEALCLAPWPLNIRQLVQVARSAAASIADDEDVGRNALTALLAEAAPPTQAEAPATPVASRATSAELGESVLGSRRALWLARHQEDLAKLLQALQQARHGNVSAAARSVGLPRSVAVRLLEADAQLKGTLIRRS